MKILKFILLLHLFGLTAFSQNMFLSPEKLKEDVDYYFKMLYLHHPNPYYFYSLDLFEEKKNQIYSKLNSSMTLAEFSWIIGEINSLIDSHSTVNFIPKTSSLNDYIKEKNKFFPYIKIKNDKIYLANDLKNSIARINGIPTHVMLNEIKKYYNWKLPHEPNIFVIESWFNYFIYLKYKIESPFEVTYENVDLKNQKIEGIDFKELGNNQPTLNIRHNLDIYSYKIFPNSSIAIFYNYSFLEKFHEKFNKELAAFNQEVDKNNIKYIFFDLSKNSGGQHFGENALDIIEHDSVFFRHKMIKRTNIFNRKYKVNERLLLPKRNDKIKNRELFILQGTLTRSRGDYFCRIVSQNKLGILVGLPTSEPTVAFTYCNDYTMPNSKIQFIIAGSLMDFSDEFKDETLNPDIYWNTNHNNEFTEEELIEIINLSKNK